MKSPIEDFRSKLRSEPTFIPTNKEFDSAALLAYLNAWITTHRNNHPEDAAGFIDTCMFLPTLQTIFVFFEAQIRLTIENAGLPKEIFSELLIAQANVTYLSTREIMKAERADKADIDLSDLFAHQTASLDNEVGNINTASALASGIDVLNQLLTLIGGDSVQISDVERATDFDAINSLNNVYRIGSAYFGFKTSYDTAIWNDGYIFKVGEHKHAIRFLDHRKVMLEEVGRFRVQQDSFATLIEFKKLFENQLLQGKRVKANVCIRDAKLVNGNVTFTLGDGYDLDESNHEIEHQAAIYAYYDFLENASLPNLPALKILDLVEMLNMVQSLYRKVSDSIIGKDCYTVADIQGFSCRIKKQQLTEYLEDRTTYKRNEIDFFVNLLINPGNERVSFWNYPFYEIGENLVAPIMTVTNAMIFHLVDRWLEQTGSSLKLRGRQLESYLQDELKRLFQRSGFFCQISERKKFKSSTNEREEIDLIINLRDIVIVAEVKCIKYPMEIRDYHNAYKRLVEGAIQINRKADYYEKYRGEFEPHTGPTKNKSIVRLVITNYPIFSACDIDGVPIVDVRWLKDFVKHRHLITYHAYEQNEQTFRKGQNSVTLYSDEIEFGQVFEHQMRNPELIEGLMEKVAIQEVKMSLQAFPIEITREGASFVI